MKLDCVLTAVDENPLYLEFLPLFVETWNKLYPQVDVKVVLIATSIPEEYLGYEKNIILFEPLEGVPTAFTAQFIRLLYPGLLKYKNGVMITDMDMIPMNKTYYTEHIKKCTDDKFIYLREYEMAENNEIAMCYNVALPGVWRDVFQVYTMDDVLRELKNADSTKWSTDQVTLHNKITEWHKKTNNFVRLKDHEMGFLRLDRDTFHLNNEFILWNIKNGLYSDYHCYRPMSKYRDINNAIYKLITS